MRWKRSDEIDLGLIADVNERWWQNALGRPVIRAVFTDDTALSGQGYAPKNFLPNYDWSLSAAEALRQEYRATTAARYLGDGFPLQWMNFGPGVLAAMVGGEGHSAPETVWFEPGKFAGLELADFHIEFNPDSPWAQRLAAMYRAATALQPELPCILGMSDLGGVFDVLASLRGTETLLMDLFDAPDEVTRLLAEEGEAWRAAYEYFDALIRAEKADGPVSCWAGILSPRRCYMLQSDFSYMISPEMFADFTAPELAKQCRFLDHAFYHLDGKAQLLHLPHLFAIPNLNGIQWIPGDGAPPQCEWPEVLDAIEDAGLKLQLLGGIDNVEPALRRMKHPERAHVVLSVGRDELARAERLVADFS